MIIRDCSQKRARIQSALRLNLPSVRCLPACCCCLDLVTPCNRTRKGHLTKADLAEGLRIASPTAFTHLSNAGSLESELAEEFAAMDVNGDGKVSFEEFKTALSGVTGLGVGPPLNAAEEASSSASAQQSVPVSAH